DKSPEGDLFEEAARLGVRVVTVPNLHRAVRPLADLRAVVGLVRLFKRERPDIVHTHSSKAGLVGRLAARLAGVPAIAHTVHGWSFHDEMPRLVRRAVVVTERLAARWTSLIVVVGERDAEIGRVERIGHQASYALIRSGIEVAAYSTSPEARAKARSAFGIPEGVPLVGTVTRLSRQKDPTTLLTAVRLVVDVRPDVHCVIVGDGPLRSEVEAHVRELGLRSQVTLLGARDDVAALLPGFDAFVLSSRWEGLPRVVIEAMAAGVPVVATDVGGVAEAVDDGTSGLLVPVGDEHALAQAVLRVIGDPVLAADMGRAAETRVGEFDTSVMIDRLDRAYRELLARGGRRRPRRRRIARAVRRASGHDAA
ncbi:MAG: glycosyltransferase family 4 protein, partial [Nocardioidaceae bacterium]